MNSATTGLPWEIVAWQRRKPGRRVEREAGAVVLVEVLPVTEAPPQERRGAARISNPHGRVRGGGAVTSKAAPFKKRRMTTSQRKAIAELREAGYDAPQISALLGLDVAEVERALKKPSK